MKFVIKLLASFFGLGYAPVASGTFGTLGGILIYWLEKDQSLLIRGITFVMILIIGIWVAGEADKLWKTHDNGKIVIDEVAGYFIGVLFFPFSWPLAIFGFFSFRLFDISKLYPASYFDKNVRNGTGVMLDDVVAGIYSLITVFIFYKLGITYGWL